MVVIVAAIKLKSFLFLAGTESRSKSDPSWLLESLFLLLPSQLSRQGQFYTLLNHGHVETGSF